MNVVNRAAILLGIIFLAAIYLTYRHVRAIIHLQRLVDEMEKLREELETLKGDINHHE